MTPAPLQTEEEIQLVKDCIIAPVLLDVLEHDMRAITLTKLKLPYPYRRKFRSMQKEVTLELTNLRQMMRQLGIKIYSESRSKEYLEAHYMCRGYDHEMILMWDTIKAEVEIRLSHYLQVSLDDDGDDEPP
jgi:hypothetical protein